MNHLNRVLENKNDSSRGVCKPLEGLLQLGGDQEATIAQDQARG